MLSLPDKDTDIDIINRKDYVSKVSLILSDTEKFLKDAIELREQKSIKISKKRKDEFIITGNLYGNNRSTGSVIPRSYGCWGC